MYRFAYCVRTYGIRSRNCRNFFKKYWLSPVDRFSRPQSRRFILVGSAAGHERRARLLVGNRLTNFRTFLRLRLMRYLTFVIPILSLLFIASCKPEPTEHEPAACRAAPGFFTGTKSFPTVLSGTISCMFWRTLDFARCSPMAKPLVLIMKKKSIFPCP